MQLRKNACVNRHCTFTFTACFPAGFFKFTYIRRRLLWNQFYHALYHLAYFYCRRRGFFQYQGICSFILDVFNFNRACFYSFDIKHFSGFGMFYNHAFLKYNKLHAGFYACAFAEIYKNSVFLSLSNITLQREILDDLFSHLNNKVFKLDRACALYILSRYYGTALYLYNPCIDFHNILEFHYRASDYYLCSEHPAEFGSAAFVNYA